MRLRNKRTGEIIEKYPDRFVINSGDQIRQYDSLAELNLDWEDVPEEPKEYWYVDDAGVEQIDQALSSEINMRKSIGNYFSSREEAELAVRKLNAWRRLKDKGFRFDGYDVANRSDGVICGQVYFKAGNYDKEEIKDNLNLLFNNTNAKGE